MIDPKLFAELRDLCLRSFPERLDQRLLQVEPVVTGRHPALAFSLSWREGVRPRVERLLVQRYADDRTWWPGQDGRQAEREWTMLRWLYAHGLPVPRPYAWSVQDADSFFLLERPTGRPIALDPDGEATEGRGADRGALPDRGLAARQQHVDALGTLLAQLHRLSAPESVREVLPRIEVQDQLAQIAQLAHQQGDTSLMEAMDELSQYQVEAYPPCVLHGDPQLAGLQCDARGVTAWLGWENSALGDPRWDVACVTNELQRSQRHSWADRFCEVYAGRAGIQLHDMAYWQALAAMQRWAMTGQVHPTMSGEDSSLSPVQLEPIKQQSWTALAHLRDARAAAASHET